MIKITLVNGKKYKGVYRWKDVSLQKFCDLASINMPDGYEEYIIADGKFSTETVDKYVQSVSKITEKQLTEDFPEYYKKVISCLSNVPINELTSDEVNDLYEWHFKPFVVSLLYHTPVIHFMGLIKAYEPEQIKGFRIGLDFFKLPETVRILEQEIPLAKESILSYTEASDIFRGMKVSKDDVKRLSLFMAIYCRKRGEKYDERKALERQSLMMKAPMSVVWSVFFYTVRRLRDSSQTIQLFGKLPKQIREVVQGVRAYQDMAVVD